MAKASRSKKQPDFDPTELSDLIFTPAVGKGVGSHLLEQNEILPPLPDLSTVVETKAATVAKSEVATVDERVSATVVSSPMPTVAESEKTTVGDSVTATVVESEMATVDERVPTTVANPQMPTMDESVAATVDNLVVWITEEGTVVSQARVRRIGIAEDAVSQA